MVMTIAPAAMDPVGSSNCELPVEVRDSPPRVMARWVASATTPAKQVVPREDEHEDRGVTMPGAASGANHLAERLGGVAPSSSPPLQIPGNLPEEAESV